MAYFAIFFVVVKLFLLDIYGSSRLMKFHSYCLALGGFYTNVEKGGRVVRFLGGWQSFGIGKGSPKAPFVLTPLNRRW